MRLPAVVLVLLALGLCCPDGAVAQDVSISITSVSPIVPGQTATFTLSLTSSMPLLQLPNITVSTADVSDLTFLPVLSNVTRGTLGSTWDIGSVFRLLDANFDDNDEGDWTHGKISGVPADGWAIVSSAICPNATSLCFTSGSVTTQQLETYLDSPSFPTAEGELLLNFDADWSLTSSAFV